MSETKHSLDEPSQPLRGTGLSSYPSALVSPFSTAPPTVNPFAAVAELDMPSFEPSPSSAAPVRMSFRGRPFIKKGRRLCCWPGLHRCMRLRQQWTRLAVSLAILPALPSSACCCSSNAGHQLQPDALKVGSLLWLPSIHIPRCAACHSLSQPDCWSRTTASCAAGLACNQSRNPVCFAFNRVCPCPCCPLQRPLRPHVASLAAPGLGA